MPTFRDIKLPELKFEMSEDMILAILEEYLRETYSLSERIYDLNFIKSAIDNKYHVTASLITAEARRPMVFSELRPTAEKESTFDGSVFPPFTINTGTPPQNTNTDTNVSEEHRGSDNSIPENEVPR